MHTPAPAYRLLAPTGRSGVSVGVAAI